MLFPFEVAIGGKLPPLSGQELVRLLAQAGFQLVRRKGSHVSLAKGQYKTVVVRKT